MIRTESNDGNPNMATRITVSLPDKEHAALAALARRNDVSLSWLTRKAVMEFLQRHTRDSAPLALDLPSRDRTGTE
jgi:predicted transcriptional regulator